MMDFANLLKSLRKKYNTKQKDIVDFLGIPLRTYQSYEYGKVDPNLSTLTKIADYFNVSLDYLVGRTKILNAPEGSLTYAFKDENGTLEGTIKYVFGIYEQKGLSPKFIYLEEKPGTLIQRSISSQTPFEFYTIAYLLNNELGLHYDASKNNGLEIIIKMDGAYFELYPGQGIKLTSRNDYKENIDNWIKLPVEEKKRILAECITSSFMA